MTSWTICYPPSRLGFRGIPSEVERARLLEGVCLEAPAPPWWCPLENPIHSLPEEEMADEPRDQRPKLRLSQLSHGAG